MGTDYLTCMQTYMYNCQEAPWIQLGSEAIDGCLLMGVYWQGSLDVYLFRWLSVCSTWLHSCQQQQQQQQGIRQRRFLALAMHHATARHGQQAGGRWTQRVLCVWRAALCPTDTALPWQDSSLTHTHSTPQTLAAKHTDYIIDYSIQQHHQKQQQLKGANSVKKKLCRNR